MIASKIYSITIALYLVSCLFSAVLVDSAKIKCDKKALKKEFNTDKQEFVVLLKHNKGSTSAASDDSENTAILKQHLNFFKDCLDIDSKPLLDKNGGKITTKKTSPDTVLHFSGGNLFGYVGFFNPRLIKQQIKSLPNIKLVEKVTEVEAFAPVQNNGGSTTVSTSFYDLDRIDQKDNKLNGKYTFPSPAGGNVNVYVVDTGINSQNKVEFGDRVRFGFFCSKCVPVDDNGHGSAVASVIGGSSFGVAKKVNLIAVKVLTAAGTGTSSDVIAGLVFVLNEHKANKNKNTVVNMSLGGGFSQALNNAVQTLTDAGIHVVVAAGNDAVDACKVSPASTPSAITVCATEKTSDSITNFSNFGSCVDICAPGRDVPSLFLGTIPRELSGTSLSSPLVAGAVALKISAIGNLSPSKMANELFSDSTKNIITKLPAGTPNRFLFVSQKVN
nr:6010_t:CDS:1 [Entrophospora candida]